MNIADGIWHTVIQNARPMPTHLFRPQHAQVRITRITEGNRIIFNMLSSPIWYVPSAKSKPTRYNPVCDSVQVSSPKAVDLTSCRLKGTGTQCARCARCKVAYVVGKSALNESHVMRG